MNVRKRDDMLSSLYERDMYWTSHTVYIFYHMNVIQCIYILYTIMPRYYVEQVDKLSIRKLEILNDEMWDVSKRAHKY